MWVGVVAAGRRGAAEKGPSTAPLLLLPLQVIAAERAAAAAVKLAEQADAAQRGAAADAKQQAALAARVQVELDTTVMERTHAQRQLAAAKKQVGGGGGGGWRGAGRGELMQGERPEACCMRGWRLASLRICLFNCH